MQVNCETDFVARNETFQQFVGTVTQSFFDSYTQRGSSSSGPINTHQVDSCTLSSLHTSQSTSMGDELAKTVGKLSEKISLHRGVAVHSSDSLVISCSHGSIPHVPHLPCTVGTFGALVALQGSGSEDAVRGLGSRIGLQVIGTNPQGIEPADRREMVGKEDWLISQQYLFDSTITVQELLEKHGTTVKGFVRYSCGDN